MNDTVNWTDLARLARCVRASDSLTNTLSLWTGHAVTATARVLGTDAETERRVGLELDLPRGAVLQTREVVLRTPDHVVATAQVHVVVNAEVFPRETRNALADGGSLGTALRPLQRKRVALRVVPQQMLPTGDWESAVLASTARLDVAGWPVALCFEQVLEGALAPTRHVRAARAARTAALSTPRS